MTDRRRTATIIIHKEGELESKSIRVPLWFLRFSMIAGIVLAVVILVAAALYTPMVRTAARVPGQLPGGYSPYDRQGPEPVGQLGDPS